jgi:DNA polymerase III delta prime subunit/very-short-patch-repair endonuclease
MATPPAQPARTNETRVLREALAQLRLKLLDLTARNRLLNYRHPIGKSLQFVEGPASALYARLSDAKGIVNIQGLPEPTRRDWEMQNGRLSRPDQKGWARVHGIATEAELPQELPNAEPRLRALMYLDDLAKHCRKIEREALLAIEETGANMLYLVLGFLEYPDQKQSDRFLTAPLLSIPVSMLKRSQGPNQVFGLRYTGDDITENLSLREKLKQDHALILPELDEEELDINAYFAAVKKATRAHAGFTFRNRTSLCLLSFTNMLLVRDLDPENWPTLKGMNGLVDHPLVRRLFAGEGSNDGGNPLEPAQEHPVEEPPGSSIPLVFDADSSQHSALVDVLAGGKNLVIEGPPGTGKSQTITNLIAACLEKNKKVLFVAEKLAALQVVKARLSQAGLDPFVLELHSSKSNKKQVLEQIGARLDLKCQPPRDLKRKVDELELHRKELKAYADLLNTTSNNAFGLTLFEVMWKAEKHRAQLSISTHLQTVAIDDAETMNGLELSRRCQCLQHLALQYQAIKRFDRDHPFWGLWLAPLSPGEEIEIHRLFLSLLDTAERLSAAADGFRTLLGDDLGLSYPETRLLKQKLDEFVRTTSDELPLDQLPGLFDFDPNLIAVRRTLEEFENLTEKFYGLSQSVNQTLIDEGSASTEKSDLLRKVQRDAAKAGMRLGSALEIEALSANLARLSDQLNSTVSAVQTFCAQNRIPFDPTPAGAQRISELQELLRTAPDEHLELESEQLTVPACPKLLASLEGLFDRWQKSEAQLDATLYLDQTPDPNQLREAILTLRQGQTWYRFLQPRWRSAIALHKGLQRIKQNVRSEARLRDVEQLATLGTLRQQWQTHPAWQEVFKKSASPSPISIKPYLLVAQWNQKAIAFMSELGSEFIDTATLNVPRLKELRKGVDEACRNMHNACDIATSIKGLVPSASEPGDSYLAIAESTKKVATIIDGCIPLMKAEVTAVSSIENAITGYDSALERRRLADVINSKNSYRTLLKKDFDGTNSCVNLYLSLLFVGEHILELNLPLPVLRALQRTNPRQVAIHASSQLSILIQSFGEIESFKSQIKRFGNLDWDQWSDIQEVSTFVESAGRIRNKCIQACDSADSIVPWSTYLARRDEAKGLALQDFASLMEGGQIAPEELDSGYAYATFCTVVRNAFKRFPRLGRFAGTKHELVREQFRCLDQEIIKVRGKDLSYRCALTAAPPHGTNGTRVDDKSEMVLVQHLLPQQKPRMPLRKLLRRAGRSIQELKPCFMMGPQAVAQYLSAGELRFDLVIMDEASQLKPEEAIGAIARGTQLVVVGDPKQLPPTSFFSRMSQMAEEEEQFTTTDAESILDICLSHFRPPRPLRWHYRSKHHSLIAFSNHYFYRNLIIFPSPYGHSTDLGIRVTYLPDAVYEDQTNYKEAIRVVDAVINHIAERPNDSLGIATLNLKQRDLIAELLEERLVSVDGADAFKERWKSEGQPLFVKNLENVQGDERDAIIISTTFGKPHGANVVRQNFGPISRQGGWRRLNVLFTRARKSLAIVTSLKPEDIVIDAQTPQGTKVLRNYLEFVRSGSLVEPELTDGGPESDFETSVIEFLRRHNFDVTPQLGVAGYRIDIAVKHPDFPNAYLAAIECDGASYHSAPSVRDRDRIRQEILESMGWQGRIWRIWSTDWFRKPQEESKRLVDFLSGLRNSWKPQFRSGPSWVEVSKEANTRSESHREKFQDAMLESEDDLAVRIGDVVRYIDIKKPEDTMTVRITENTKDLEAGLIHRGTPLAQVLLGAAIGDEVVLHLAGGMARTFRIVEVKREPVVA